jgi:hypothetical protein
MLQPQSIVPPTSARHNTLWDGENTPEDKNRYRLGCLPLHATERNAAVSLRNPSNQVATP